MALHYRITCITAHNGRITNVGAILEGETVLQLLPVERVMELYDQEHGVFYIMRQPGDDGSTFDLDRMDSAEGITSHADTDLRRMEVKPVHDASGGRHLRAHADGVPNDQLQKMQTCVLPDTSV